MAGNDYLSPPLQRAEWLQRAEKLAAEGLTHPAIASALARRGYSQLAITFALAALTSDAKRADRHVARRARLSIANL